MTFYEAALEVLRSIGRPLDYKAITQEAIRRELLGHIGRTPDVVMASCLMRASARESESLLTRTEDGCFALRTWPEEQQQTAALLSFAQMPLPSENLALLERSETFAKLEVDNEHFRQVIHIKYEGEVLSEEGEESEPWRFELAETKRHENLRLELNAQHNEHFNLCAAIVKVLRREAAPLRSAQLAQILSQKSGVTLYEHALVLAMRADNALRASRGKRAVFTHITPDLWTLSENFLSKHVLKLESKLYDLSRQLRLYAIQALTIKIRELSEHAWQQLASIIIKYLNYTISSQYMPNLEHLILRAEELRGLSYIPVLIEVLHSKYVESKQILAFREIIQELGYDHGVLLVNGDVSRDALNECMTRECPIYAYSAKQVASIMLDAKIGVTPNAMPVVFIDNQFFEALSQKGSKNNPVALLQASQAEVAKIDVESTALVEEDLGEVGIDIQLDMREDSILFEENLNQVKAD